MTNLSRLSSRRPAGASRARLLVLAAAAVLLVNQVIVASASDLSINPGVIGATVSDGGPALPRILAADEFDADGTLGTAKPGGLWSQEGSVWGIASKSAAAVSPGPSHAYLTLNGVVDGHLDVVVDTRSSTRAGVFIRDDSANGIIVLYRSGPPLSPQPELQLYVRIGGGALTSPAASAPLPATDLATLRVTVAGPRVEVRWNGVVALSYAMSPSQTAAVSDPGSSRWGLWVQEGASPRYSHFRVEGVEGTAGA